MAKILGIDEVGRGPLAGPLVVGAVILPEWGVVGGDDGDDGGNGGGVFDPEWIGELRDSKKLSAKKREALSEVILAEAPAVGLGWVTPAELDEVGISEALRLATRRAVLEVRKRKVPFSQIVIDGTVNFLAGTSLGPYVTTVVKADDKIREVSAASIVAKVARDRYMTETSARYPEYGFEKHVGYGTAAHRQAIMEFGVCPEHRLSFEPCRSLVGFERGSEVMKKNTTDLGAKGEEAVASYLAEQGHEIVARNFKTYFCEIDIVSVFEGKVYFTEVKYRRDNARGGGLAAIDKAKQEQMRFAAEVFLKFHPEFISLDPLLAAAAVEGREFVVREWFPI